MVSAQMCINTLVAASNVLKIVISATANKVNTLILSDQTIVSMQKYSYSQELGR